MTYDIPYPIRFSEEMIAKARLKEAQTGISLPQAVRQLVAAWVAGDIVINERVVVTSKTDGRTGKNG